MSRPVDATRHTSERLNLALKLCKEHWEADSPPFFIGGGSQCDVYGFEVPTARSIATVKPFSNDGASEGAEPVKNTDQARVCLRIPRSTLEPEEGRRLIEVEASWRTKIADAGLAGIQRMVRYDLSCDNALNSPYIALEWANGKPLVWDDTVPEKQEDRQKVIKQVVELSMGLLRIREDGCSARAYMQTLIDRQIEKITKPDSESTTRTLKAEAKEGMKHFSSAIMDRTHDAEAMHLAQKLLLDKHIIKELNDAPHVLIHGDLGPNNVIIDADYNITLIDLGFMHLEPLQLSAYFPRFLLHEPSSVDSDCPFDTRMDTQAWVRGWGLADTPQMAMDRKHYIECVRKVADEEVDEELKGLMKLYSKVLEREDEVERFWWMQAMQRVDIWLQMERCGWEPRK